MAVVDAYNAGAQWRRVFAILLGVLAVGLPINNISDYTVLVTLTVIIFCGEVSARPRAWAAAVAIVIAGVMAQTLVSSPRIEEGHNVFVPGPRSNAGCRAMSIVTCWPSLTNNIRLRSAAIPGKPAAGGTI